MSERHGIKILNRRTGAIVCNCDRVFEGNDYTRHIATVTQAVWERRLLGKMVKAALRG